MADTKDTQNGFEIDGASLDNILAQVEQELAPVLKAEKDRLVKAKEDDGDDKGSDGPPAKEESSPSAEESSPEAPPADASASAPPASPPAPPAAGPDAGSPPVGAPPASPGSALPADPAALAQMIAAMPLEQQKAIYLASKQSLAASLAAGSPPAGPDASAAGAGAPPMAPPMAPPEASAPPAPPASAPPADASGAPPMDPAMKNEMKPSEGNGGKTMPVKKTEKPVVQTNKDNEELKALVKAQDEKIGQLTKIVGMLAGTPVRKAVTSVGVLRKTEDGKDEQKSLTKSEMTTQLTEMIKSNKLSKKDREQVRKFYDQGSTDLNLIQHLFQ